jgi:hypothetical protein
LTGQAGDWSPTSAKAKINSGTVQKKGNNKRKEDRLEVHAERRKAPSKIGAFQFFCTIPYQHFQAINRYKF